METRTWDIDEGIRRLETLLQALPAQAGPAEVLDAALELVPVGSRGDDVAVLAARIPTGMLGATDRVERTLPAQPMSVPLARAWAEAWLVERRTPGDLCESVLLVASELVTNAVRQSDVPVRVALQAEADAVVVEVYDGNPRLPRMTEVDVDSPGGRGLFLVDVLSSAWDVREEREGKTVWARLEDSLV